jgi:hypothetical protein
MKVQDATNYLVLQTKNLIYLKIYFLKTLKQKSNIHDFFLLQADLSFN